MSEGTQHEDGFESPPTDAAGGSGPAMHAEALLGAIGPRAGPPAGEWLRLHRQPALTAPATAGLEVDQQEVEHVLVPVRLVLERLAFRHSMRTLDSEDVAYLAALCHEMRVAGGEADAQRLADTDVAFHEFVMLRSGQTQCLDMWRAIRSSIHAYFFRDALGHYSDESVARQHEELLAALTAGNELQLLRVLEDHIRLYLEWA